MWVHRVAPFLCLKASFMMLFIRDLSKSCEMEVYRVEKSNVSYLKNQRLATCICIYDMTVQKAKTINLKKPETRDKG